MIRKFVWKYNESGKSKTVESSNSNLVGSQAVLPTWMVLLADLCSRRAMSRVSWLDRACVIRPVHRL